MGPTAKVGLVCAMGALLFAGQLLEKEFASRRRAALEAKKGARPEYADLLIPPAPADLPRPPAGTPRPPPGASTPTSTAAPASSGETVYTVQQGDTIARIAKKFFGSEGAIDLIAERNKKTLPDPAKLQVGMTLHIPSRERPAPR